MTVSTTTHTWKTAGNVTLTLEVDRPDGRGPFPVVLYIHGGAWVSGSSNMFEGYAHRLAEVGYAGVRINYRKRDIGATFTETMEDVLDAVGWVRGQASAFAFDTSRLALAGISAGAHLAAQAWPHVPEAVALVGICGVYDLVPEKELLTSLGEDIEHYFAPFTDKGLAAASPQYQIGPNPPATLLLHGTHDEVVPYTQSIDYAEALQKQGGDVRVVLFSGEDHCFSRRPEARADEFGSLMEGFFRQTIGL